MTAQRRTETTHSKTTARRRAGTAASGRRSRPIPRRGTAGPLLFGAAVAAVLVAALAAGSLSAYAAGPGQGAGGEGQYSTAANATGDEAYPTVAAPPVHESVCGLAYGGHPDGAPAAPSPAQIANMTSRIDALYAEYDAILAEYGFVYREPANLTGAQMDRIEAEMSGVMARYDGMLDEIEALAMRPYAAMPGFPFDGLFGPHATLTAVYQLIGDEHDDILRRHGFVIATPQLSDADERRLSERIDAVMDKMDRVYEEYCMDGGGPMPADPDADSGDEPPAPAGADGGGTAGHAHGASAYGLAPAASPLYAEVDAILAEYGFVYSEPANLTAAQLDEIDARTVRLLDRHSDAVEGLAARLAPMLANGSITVAGAFSEDMRLAERANAEYSAMLAEFGYVIVTPDLSAKDREAMDKRLAAAYARIDSALKGAHTAHGEGSGDAGGADAGGDGDDAGQAGAASTGGSDPSGPPASPPSSGDNTVYDAFNEEERRAAQSGAEHEAPAAGYDYLTATSDPSSGDGTLVSVDLADIYGGIDAALGGDYSETYGSTADDGGGGGEAAAAYDGGGGNSDEDAAATAHRSP